jgi:penicillin-binding protein 2
MAGSSLQLKDHWQEQRLFLSRIIAAAIVVLLLAGLVVARLVQLQVVDHERFVALSQGNRFRIDPLPPTRGIIYDRNGLVIAENRPNWELVAIGEQIQDLDRTLRSLEVLGLVDPSEHDELRALIRSHRGFERVKLSNLTEEQAATFAVRRHMFSGVDIQEALSRYYPFGELSAHAIGYVGSISQADLDRIDRSNYAGTSHIGKTGIERAYEDQLHGRVGYRQLVVNAQGRVVEVIGAGLVDARGVETKLPVPGQNVVLSLDMKLQIAAQDAMQDLRGAVVAIDPRNGDVLALVSTPSFDPNRFAAGLSRADYNAMTTDPDKPLYNRALAGTYPPGSTIKPFLALSALQNEAMTPDEERSCPGHSCRPDRHRPHDLPADHRARVERARTFIDGAPGRPEVEDHLHAAVGNEQLDRRRRNRQILDHPTEPDPGAKGRARGAVRIALVVAPSSLEAPGACVAVHHG